MRNDMHPLLMALKKKSQPAPERLFQINREEIPLEKRYGEGEDASFGVHGKVKAVNADGSLSLFVHRVEHQPQSSNAVEAPKEPIITTQQSHVP